MARRGSFSGGTNPFGSKGIGGLSKYDIASDVAEYDLYAAQVGWTNGTVPDADYLAACKKALDAAPPNTTKYVTAKNRYEDAQYTIGRRAADDKGLDALIAYDQQALAKLSPDNAHAKDVKETLNNELAQKRSKDYGALVDKVNSGKMSTKDLADWVATTMKTLPADAPDLDNWSSVATDLSARVQDEKDSQVYQDYQMGRTDGKTFLAYIQSRRDQFDQTSPKWADWNRKLEDATKNVTDTELAKQDSAFFNLYNEGKKSDTDYLGYIKKRLDAMKQDDPDYEDWRHRYVTASFSVAEDKLRFDVEHKTQPVSALIKFYQGYAAGLNKGSAEYRQIIDRIDALKGYGGGSGGSGGGGSYEGVGPAISALPKAISNTYSLDNVLHLMTINPTGASKNRKVAEAAFGANYNSLKDAYGNGDKVWLFIDPTKPGQTVQAQDSQGNKIVGKDGKPVMVRGASYLPVSSDALGNLEALSFNYHYSLAQIALSKGDMKTFYTETKTADEAEQRSRTLGSQVIKNANQKMYDSIQSQIEAATQKGDAATVYNLTQKALRSISGDLQDTTLTDAKRTALENLAQKLADNPLYPKTVLDPNGGISQVGGAINATLSTKDADGNMINAVMNPGWHYSLDVDSQGTAKRGWEYSQMQPQEWAETHQTITTTFHGDQVTGDVKVQDGNTSGVIQVNTPEGVKYLYQPDKVSMIQYADDHGNLIKAYSVDNGETWVAAGQGDQLPMLTLQGNYTLGKSDSGPTLLDDSGKVIATLSSDGKSWKFQISDPALQFLGVSDPDTRMPWESVGAQGSHMQIFRFDKDGNKIDMTKPEKTNYELRNIAQAGMASVGVGNLAGASTDATKWLTPEQEDLGATARAQAEMASHGIGSLSGIGPGETIEQKAARAKAGMASVGIGSLSGIGPGQTDAQRLAMAQAARADLGMSASLGGPSFLPPLPKPVLTPIMGENAAEAAASAKKTAQAAANAAMAKAGVNASLGASAPLPIAVPKPMTKKELGAKAKAQSGMKKAGIGASLAGPSAPAPTATTKKGMKPV